ncbi:MAG: hypothetical protein ACFFA0_16515, partial [Promethearchaeota archaeon]
MIEKLKGYKEEGKKLLEKNKIEIWDIIQVKTSKTNYEGIVLPRSEYSAPNFINLKLENNYNIGINVSEIQEIK